MAGLWKGLLSRLRSRQRVVGTMVSRFQDKTEQGQPETQALLSRFRGDVYNCVNIVSSALADAACPQLYAKVKSTEKINYATKPVGRFHKSNIIDVVGTENVQQVMDHPVLELLSRPNEFWTMHDMFEVTQVFMSLAGIAHWHVVRDGMGTPKEIWPLMPHKMRYVLNRRGLIDHWVFKADGEDITFSANSIIYFRRVSPLDAIQGYSPLRGVLTPSDTSEMIIKYINSMVENRAVPDLIMTVRGALSKEKVDRHRELWEEQFRKSNGGGLALIPGDDATVTPLAWKPKDMENIQAYQQLRESICAAFNVPITMLAMEGSNRATADAAMVWLAKMGTKPNLSRISGVLNRDLVPMYDESRRLMLGFPDPVPENKELAIQERETNLRIGMTTVNEEREKAGMEAIAGGDKLRDPDAVGEPSAAEGNNPNDSATRIRMVTA